MAIPTRSVHGTLWEVAGLTDDHTAVQGTGTVTGAGTPVIVVEPAAGGQRGRLFGTSSGAGVADHDDLDGK